jgi:hypothetical protein
MEDSIDRAKQLLKGVRAYKAYDTHNYSILYMVSTCDKNKTREEMIRRILAQGLKVKYGLRIFENDKLVYEQKSTYKKK